MNKHNFIGDGKTKHFYFTFPFFTKNDVIVEINGKVATDFGLYCTLNTLNADIPFSGGKVSFTKAPKTADVITIYRKLELNRVVDYQPSAKISPVVLNQDMNFMLEVLKDMQNKLVEFASKYSEIMDKESTQVLLTQINAVTDEITNVISEITNIRTEIADLGDISSIQSNISSLNNSINTLNGAIDDANANIATLRNFHDGVHDYVIEYQTPSAENNYTWYRKYKSGWVEQGQGLIYAKSSTVTTHTLPIEMSNTNYTIAITSNMGNSATGGYSSGVDNITTTSFNTRGWNTGTSYGNTFSWYVCGIAA